MLTASVFTAVFCLASISCGYCYKNPLTHLFDNFTEHRIMTKNLYISLSTFYSLIYTLKCILVFTCMVSCCKFYIQKPLGRKVIYFVLESQWKISLAAAHIPIADHPNFIMISPVVMFLLSLTISTLRKKMPFSCPFL